MQMKSEAASFPNLDNCEFAMNITLLPAGAWGTAMALHLSRCGHTVTLVPRTIEEATEMATIRENRAFFAGFKLPQSIQIALEPGPALMEAEMVIIACPSKFLRSLCGEISPYLSPSLSPRLKIFISLCKGLEEGTNKLPATVLQESLPGHAHGVLSGPTFASQVALGQPSAIVLATDAPEDYARRVQEALSGPSLRVYTSRDMIGVELGGCLKNVYAIASGICDGLGLRDNAKAALLTRSLAEMVRVGVVLGGQKDSFYGLTGFGDLVLTCNGKESRNRSFGELFAQGVSVETLINERQMTVEGYRTCACFHSICCERGIDAPILSQIHAILFEGKSAQEALLSLMSRELKAETD
jgi:glycerol-3-phosphate dehydrogenase (NAD(P)+)